jgi:hypothetical protein
MNNLIWITEKELNYENRFVSKIKGNKEISGCWCYDNDVKPITFDGENLKWKV